MRDNPERHPPVRDNYRLLTDDAVLVLLDEVIQPRDMCQRLVDYGYAGGWPWQWNEHAEPILACLKAMTRARDAVRSDAAMR